MNKSDPNTHYSGVKNCASETENVLPSAHAYMTIPLYNLSAGIDIAVKFAYSFKNRQRKVSLCKYLGLVTNR